MSIFIRTVPNVMRHFGCSADDAQRYIDLRDEGYPAHQASVMTGLSDPPEPQAVDAQFGLTLDGMRRAKLI